MHLQAVSGRRTSCHGEPGSIARDGVGQIFVDPSDGKPTCGDLVGEASEYGFFTLAFGDIAVERG